MKPKPCSICQSIYHTKMKCPKNPVAQAKAKATRERMIEKARQKQQAEAIERLSKARKPKTRTRKPTTAQIRKKEREGGTITKAERKILYDRQKAKAWKAFSDFKRHEGCYESTGTFTAGYCITCKVAGRPSLFPYSRLQAGHGVGSRCNAILFHEELVNIQCDHDNRQGAGGLAGDYGNYAIYLVEKYGLEHAKYLQSLKYAHKTITYDDLVDIEVKYKEKLEELKRSVQ